MRSRATRRPGWSELFVDALDEVVFDGDDRQRARADVGPEISLFLLEQRHSRSHQAEPSVASRLYHSLVEPTVVKRLGVNQQI
jgi:hypothetical protein